MSKPKEISTRVSELRERMGLTQEGLAKLLGISRNYVSMIEGGREPSANIVKLIEMIEHREGDAFPTDPRNAMRLARAEKGLSYVQLSKLTGYRADVLQAVEEGQGQASEKMIEALSRVLDIPKDFFMGGNDAAIIRDGIQGTYGAKPNVVTGPGVPTPRYVPLISMAQAGAMSDFNFTDEGYNGESVLAFGVKDARAFSVTIVGDSMEPRYPAGDIALLYPSFEPRIGQPVVAKLRESGSVLFKIFTPKDEGSRVVLTSYNPAHPLIEHPRSDFSWIYPVASVTHPILH